ncbi:DUF6286 domain-containing protein [Actinomadura flavalba]|uniref:DUF6286 domain-containing protein n=1 Tax=Actinomadura flavalba TaxID=1120938 RepID=UPI000361A576|nr:DUF6286 domain-containing protein [Actinomadura flavalba]
MDGTLVSELLAPAQARQQARRLARAEFAPRRTALTLVTLAVIAVLGSAVAVAVLAAVAGRPLAFVPAAELAAAARRTAWDAPAVRATGAALAVLGAALVAAGLPRHARVLVLASDDPCRVAALRRRDVRRLVSAAVRDVPGVTRVRVRVRGRRRPRVTVRARTAYRNPGTLPARVADAAETRLRSLGLRRTPRVTVRFRERTRP